MAKLSLTYKMEEFTKYLVILTSIFASLLDASPTRISISGIVQPDEFKPGKDYTHFMYKREASPEPHGGGGHGGGGHGGGGHGGGFGGGHGYGGGFGGHGGYGGFGHGVGHYGGGFGGGPIVGVGFGGFIPVPVYRRRPYEYGYGYGRYRRSVSGPQLTQTSTELIQDNGEQNVRSDTSAERPKVIDQHKQVQIDLDDGSSKDIVGPNFPLLLSAQIERERTQRSAVAVEEQRYGNIDDDYDNYVDAAGILDFTVEEKPWFYL